MRRKNEDIARGSGGLGLIDADFDTEFTTKRKRFTMKVMEKKREEFLDRIKRDKILVQFSIIYLPRRRKEENISRKVTETQRKEFYPQISPIIAD